MKTSENQNTDHDLTAAIARYIRMEPEQAYDAIAEEWHEQLALLLVDFLFKSTCTECGGPCDFVQIKRDESEGYYIVALCGCEFAPPVTGNA